MNGIKMIARTVVSAIDAVLSFLVPDVREPARIKVAQEPKRRYNARNL